MHATVNFFYTIFYYQCTLLRKLLLQVVYGLQLKIEGKPYWYGSICFLYKLWLITIMDILENYMFKILLFFGMVSASLLWSWCTPFVGYTPAF